MSALFIKKKIDSLIYLGKSINPYALLKLDLVRFLICKVRKYYFIDIKKSLKKWRGSQAHMLITTKGDSTIEHNLKGLHDVSGARALRIIKPLSVIETLRPLSEMPERGGELHDLNYPCDAKVLTIGPRTEGEIFCLMAYGFKPANIRGLDLFSYSPYIDVGDMHAMPYQNSSFDVISCSCVLVYSHMPQKACQEIIRICKNGGIVCIAQDTTPEAGTAHIASLGKPTLYCEDYLALFGKAVKRVFFQHELPERLQQSQKGSGSNYTMSLIFQIQKLQ